MSPNNTVIPSGRELIQSFFSKSVCFVIHTSQSIHKQEVHNLIILSDPTVRVYHFPRRSLLFSYPPHASRDIFNPDRFLGRAITPDADRFPYLNSQTASYYAQHLRRRVLFVPLSHSCLSCATWALVSDIQSCRSLDVNSHLTNSGHVKCVPPCLLTHFQSESSYKSYSNSPF